jgi:hypothetical protein
MREHWLVLGSESALNTRQASEKEPQKLIPVADYLLADLMAGVGPKSAVADGARLLE